MFGKYSDGRKAKIRLLILRSDRFYISTFIVSLKLFEIQAEKYEEGKDMLS